MWSTNHCYLLKLGQVVNTTSPALVCVCVRFFFKSSFVQEERTKSFCVSLRYGTLLRHVAAGDIHHTLFVLCHY